MVSAVSANAADSRINAGKSMMASNFETFLALLTAQLKNQDPLSPMDSNQFTAQLTQMAGVEQQLLTNDLLTSLLTVQQGAGLVNAASYIGHEATAAWSTVAVEDGQAKWSYELANPAETVTLQVVDSKGAVVWSGEAPQRGAGIHDFTWNGRTTAGGQVADGGVYSLKVVAKTSSGGAIDSQVLIRGRVTGVELYNGEAHLTVGASILPVSSLIALNGATAPNTPPPDPETAA